MRSQYMAYLNPKGYANMRLLPSIELTYWHREDIAKSYGYRFVLSFRFLTSSFNIYFGHVKRK